MRFLFLTPLLALATASASPHGQDKTFNGKNFQNFVIKTQLNPFSIIPEEHSRILDGEQAFLGLFPWNARIELFNRNTKLVCGGALISENFILTAAHCAKSTRPFNIYLGATDLANYEIDRILITDAHETIIHEGYDKNTHLDDIALIKLKRKVHITSKIKPIRLDNSPTDFKENQEVAIGGFGYEEPDSITYSMKLRFIHVISRTNEECKQLFRINGLTASQLCCTSLDKDEAAGKGDDGGALVEQRSDGEFVHIGVLTHYQYSENYPYFNPTIYLRTNKYYKWIQQKLAENNVILN